MATRQFDVLVQADAQYVGERWWSGIDIHSLWNVENMNTSDRSQWGTDANGWLQYRSVFGSYAIRYDQLDLNLLDYFFETELQPSGAGNYEVGVTFRFKDRYNFYYLVFNGGYQDWGGKNIRLMKMAGSIATKIADFATPVFDRSRIYKFRIELAAGNIRVLMDDTEILNITDPSPILKGAFGPIVLGQEFAKWKGFQAKSMSSFAIQKTLSNNNVTIDYYDAASAKLLSPDSVYTFVKPEIDAYLAGKTYENLTLTDFKLSSPSSYIRPIFDRIVGKNTTADQNSLMYAYQVLPTSPPITPTSLQGVALSPTEIQYNWTHVDDSEDGFYIMDEAGNVIATVGENVFTYTESGLTEGTTYARKIVAFNTAGNSTASNTVYVMTKQTPPMPPSDFMGTIINATSIKWSWSDNSFNEGSFEVVKPDVNGNMIVIASLAPGVIEYIETGLLPLTSYSRGVRAKNTAAITDVSNIATVITLDALPDTPRYAPVNFYGVGVASDTIVWSWEDMNLDESGFELVDEQGTVIAQIPAGTTIYHEKGLYSKMFYRRTVRAYNRGGAGPATSVASAFTLGYGYDYTGHPVAPFNFDFFEVSTQDLQVNWQYENHPDMPALGFKIYDDLDTLIDVIPLTVLERTIQGLLPDRTYKFYVVAYNELGDSLPSNLLTVTTLAEDEDVPEPELPVQELDDPLFGLTYDKEVITTPKIQAFQSGVGDNLDLTVKNLHNKLPNFEKFVYEIYIKGYYQGKSLTYPRVPFTFQVTCTGIDIRTSSSYSQQSDWFAATVQGEVDGLGLTFTSPLNLNIPTYVTSKKYSVEVKDQMGKTISMYRPNQPEEQVNWILDPHEQKDMVGIVEAVYMKNVFQDWRKFSHQGTAQPSNPAEMNAWTYNAETDELVCTENTGTFVGAVSPDAYDNFVTEGVFRSSDNDNDAMAYVIAFATDESGREYTLSAVRNHTLTNKWALYYNFRQSNEILLVSDDTLPDAQDTSNWNLYYPKGTVIEVSRYGDVIQAKTSPAGSEVTGYPLTVNLNDLPQLAVFKGPKPIGVGSWSQESASLKVEAFRGEKTEIYTAYNLQAWTTHTENTSEYKEWISTKSISSLIPVMENEDLKFVARIQSPAYQIPWQELNKEFLFDPDKYKVVITCQNPNVELHLDEEGAAIDFFPENSVFVNVPLSARIINHTQTAWSPYIHHGYYYLNQREHYLFADDKVLPEDDGTFAQYVYTFPYAIRVYGERTYAGKDVLFLDDVGTHFLAGMLGDGIDIDMNNGSFTLSAEATEGIFTSRLFDFGKAVSDWREFVLELEDPTTSSLVTLEVGAADEYGSVATWVAQTSGKVLNLPSGVERVRYRVTLEEGQKAQEYLMDFNQNNATLGEGTAQHIKITDRKIEISDPAFYQTGTFVTKPLEYGSQVSDMGTVTVDLNVQANARVDFYSVSAPDREHDFSVPTVESPWVPLELVGTEGVSSTFRIKSAKNPWLAIVSKLQRAYIEASTDQPFMLVDPTHFDRTLASNLEVVGDSIQLIDPTKEGRYTSRVFILPTNQGFNRSEIDTIFHSLGDAVDLYYISSSTGENLNSIASVDRNWAQAINGYVGTVQRYAMFRLIFKSGDSIVSPELKRFELDERNYQYVSPSVDNMTVQGRLFNWIRIVPQIQSVQLAGYVEPGFGTEDYLVPMEGQVVSDGLLQDITNKTARKLAEDWLMEQGVADIDQLVLKDFYAEVDPVYAVQIQTAQSGDEFIKAKTTASVGDLIWKQEELYFDAESHEIIVQPVPQAGSPVIITNAQGVLLQQVHFRDVYGQPTLTNLEELVTDESRYLFLEFADIDQESIQLYMDFENDDKWDAVYNFDFMENRIVLPSYYMPGIKAKILYKIKDSYFVDYNFDPNREYARIKVNTTFDPEVKATCRLDIKHEVNREHAYYLADEVDLNPLHNTINKGFMYLTDEIFPPYKVNVFVNPTILYRNKQDRVTVNVYVLDEFDNPVIGETVSAAAQSGMITMMNKITDSNGLVTAIYNTPNSDTIAQDTLDVQVVGRTASTHLFKSITIDLLEEHFLDKISIVPEKRMVNEGDVVQLKVIAMGPNNERIVNKPIVISANMGSVVPSSGSTNPDGEMFVNYSLPFNPDKSFVVIKAAAISKSGEAITEQNILGVSGV
jgi:hypothetical protein